MKLHVAKNYGISKTYRKSEVTEQTSISSSGKSYGVSKAYWKTGGVAFTESVAAAAAPVAPADGSNTPVCTRHRPSS